MIQDVPTSADFKDGALAFFNLGWDLLTGVAEEDSVREDLSAAQAPTFLRRKSRTLSTSALLLAQAVELALKAKVADVSPFLLLEDPAKGPNKQFSDMLTIGANDLPRLCEAVCGHQFSAHFVPRLTVARERRNKIAHSAPLSLSVTITELVQDYFFLVDELYGDLSWKKFRREWKVSEDDGVETLPHAGCRFASEMEFVATLLKPALAKRHLGITNPKRKKYCCPYCADPEQGEDQPRTAQKSDDSKSLRCFACDNMTSIPTDSIKCECGSPLLFPPKPLSSPATPRSDMGWEAAKGAGNFFQLCIECGC